MNAGQMKNLDKRFGRADDPALGDEMLDSLPDVAFDEASLKHKAEIEQKKNEWIKRKKTDR